MAVIKIFIEGGILPHPNISVQTLNNSQRLRESFYDLLSQKIDPNSFQLEVEVGGSVLNTIKFFKTEIANGKAPLLLIDLDDLPANKPTQIQSFDLEQAAKKKLVFFMVQEMESWILSQPDKIEKCYQHLKRVKLADVFGEDEILQQHPEEINKPSDKLATLLGRYFRVEKRGQWKKKKYKKLKDGADLLELLDFSELMLVFEDVSALSDKF